MRTVGSAIAACQVTGASRLADPVPATDTPRPVTPTLAAASTAETTLRDTAVRGDLLFGTPHHVRSPFCLIVQHFQQSCGVLNVLHEENSQVSFNQEDCKATDTWDM